MKILQLRESGSRVEASTGAKVLQHGLRPFKGGTTYAANTSVDYQSDRARLEALNNQLAAKGCKTFDLEAELQPGNTETPKPVGEASKK